MSWLVTAKQYIPAVIGEEFGGGYFAGYISHTADGNPTHALIVAPRATGESTLIWKTSDTATAGTANDYDGVSNMSSIVAAGLADHPAAAFCNGLSIGGYTDWYLPSALELEIAYFNLKPNTVTNGTNFGVNTYAVPLRAVNYTNSFPSKTFVDLFQEGNVEAFVGNRYWTSNTQSATTANAVFFQSGLRGNFFKSTTSWPTRAFRRIAL